MSSAPKAKIVAALYATYGTITVICSNRSLKILMMRNEVIGSIRSYRSYIGNHWTFSYS